MAISAKNHGSLTCGLVADPKQLSEKVLSLRVAADYAGSDSEDPSNKTGYFNVIYFTNGETPNAKFVANQVKEGKLKKGSQIQILFRLDNPRRKTEDGTKYNDFQLIAEDITYAGGGGARTEANGEAKVPVAAGSAPTEF